MARAWVKQHTAHVEKYGKKKASWYAVWNEPDGRRRQKSYGPGPDGTRLAQMQADTLNQQFATQSYDEGKPNRTTWDEFVGEFDRLHLSKKRPATRLAYLDSLNAFARVLKLDGKPLSRVDAEAMARFSAKRLNEQGRNRGVRISPATVNRDLRHVRAALRKAHKWGYLASVPAIDFEKEAQTAKRWVTPDHFAALFKAAESAEQPGDQPTQWWRAFIALAYCTGWRIGEILSLEWSAITLDEDGSGTVNLKARDTKGNRHARVWLHPFIIEHLKPLRTLLAEPLAFGWHKGIRQLQTQFDELQMSAGIHIPCLDERPHECSPACHRYSFHDIRRGFAIANAERMQRDELQKLIRHVAAATTERYIQALNQRRLFSVDWFEAEFFGGCRYFGVVRAG